GNDAQASFVVTNMGSASLSNGTAIITGGPFAILAGSPFNLPGFSSTNVLIGFSPASAGTFNRLISFFTDDGLVSANLVTGMAAYAPVADFRASPISGFAPLTVTFADGSTGTITNRFWDFGDGST